MRAGESWRRQCAVGMKERVGDVLAKGKQRSVSHVWGNDQVADGARLKKPWLRLELYTSGGSSH